MFSGSEMNVDGQNPRRSEVGIGFSDANWCEMGFVSIHSVLSLWMISIIP